MEKSKLQGSELYVVTYVGLSDSDYNANGRCEVNVFLSIEDAQCFLKKCKEDEIKYLKEEQREYEILEDLPDKCHLSWAFYGEQVIIEIHSKMIS